MLRDHMRRDQSNLGPFLRLAIGLAGLAMFSGGVVAVSATGNGGGSAAMVTVGAALALIAALGDRVQALELGSAKLSLRDLARGRFALARMREAAGDVSAATELRHQGLALERLAMEYAYRRRSMRGSPERTGILEHIMRQLAQLAKEHKFEAVDVWEWFNRGKPEARITAIGLMHGDRRLRDVFVALDAIEDSRSAFEQFHGLRLANEMLRDLTSVEREWLRETVERARAQHRFQLNSDRWQMSEAILAGLVTRASRDVLRARAHEHVHRNGDRWQTSRSHPGGLTTARLSKNEG
jgi:hypothetical protein